MIFRQDVPLELGEVSQTIEVTAASEQINATQGDVSSTVNEKYYEDLPVVMGADIRPIASNSVWRRNSATPSTGCSSVTRTPTGSSGEFGQVFSQCNTPRSIQFGAKLDF